MDTEKLSFREKLAYGVGDIGLTLPEGMIALLFFKFLTDYHGMTPVTAGAILAVMHVWDGVNDVLMGFIADRTKSKYGSYRPYLIFGAVPYAIIGFFIWYTPPFMGKAALAVYYAAGLILFDALNTILFIPYASLTPRITRDYDERTKLNTFRMFFSILGTMAANTLPSLFIGEMVNASQSSILGLTGVFCVISAGVFLWTGFGTRERVASSDEKPKIAEVARTAAKNKPYILAVLIYLMANASLTITISAMLYYFENSMEIKETAIPLAMLFVFALISVPLLWNPLAQKLDKRRAFIIGISFMIAARVVIMAAPRDIDRVLLYSLFAVSGVSLGASLSLPWAIIPDTMDYAELQTGKRHDGALYSLMQLSRKLASAAGPLIIAAGLTMGGYIAGESFEPFSKTDLAIRGIIGLVPIIMMICALIFACMFPLRRSDIENMARELESARKGGQYERL